MRKPPGIEKNRAVFATNITEVVKVLSVSPLGEDHTSLETIVGNSGCRLFEAHSLGSSLALLQEHDVAVVLCEKDLRPGTYIDLLEHIVVRPNAPSLIVASRLADERLWAEALNLGAWDVLAKPFDRTEVLRSVKSGWQHWHDHGEPQTDRTQRRMVATGT